jgi:DNA-3-methyladenine glycosylase
MSLPQAFYDRPTLEVARDLLGKVLVHRSRGATTSGTIVEVEAYIGESDPACHAAAGPTRRNALMYGPPGVAYVYLNYGIHYLVNVVTEATGSPAAVLIRALEPLEGLDAMRRRRGRLVKERDAAPGNGRLCIEDRGLRPGRVAWGPRIGIRVGTAQPWRGWVEGHRAVSGVRLDRTP